MFLDPQIAYDDLKVGKIFLGYAKSEDDDLGDTDDEDSDDLEDDDELDLDDDDEESAEEEI